MLLFLERFSRQTREGSWSFRKSEGCIIGTKGEQCSRQESMGLLDEPTLQTAPTGRQQVKTRPPSRFAEPFDNGLVVLVCQGLMIDILQRQRIYALRKPGNSALLAKHRVAK